MTPVAADRAAAGCAADGALAGRGAVGPRGAAQCPPMDAPTSAALRAALGRFATGVTIVTTRAPDGAPVGLTVNSFNSVSLQPPLVLWSLARASRARVVFEAGSHWAVHVLRADQRALAQRFARRDADRWAGVAWTEGAGGVPLLPQALAWFECRAVQILPGGDHLILLGEVLRCRSAEGEPLLYHRGAFAALAPGQSTCTASNAGCSASSQ